MMAWIQENNDNIKPDGCGHTVQTPGGAALTHCAVLWFCLIGNTNAVGFTTSHHCFPVVISNSWQKFAPHCWTPAKLENVEWTAMKLELRKFSNLISVLCICNVCVITKDKKFLYWGKHMKLILPWNSYITEVYVQLFNPENVTVYHANSKLQQLKHSH